MSSEPEKVATELVLDVPPGNAGETRLDVYITSFIPNVSRSKAQKGIKEGLVTIDGKIVTKGSYLVQPSERIVCTLMKSPPIEALPEDIPLDILHEDDSLIIVNKVSGMVVHPAYGNRTGTLVNALLHHVGGKGLAFSNDELEGDAGNLSTRNAGPQNADDPAIRPGLVHRLDKDTSGVMVIAKSDGVHAHLAKQFFNHSITRAYRAIVWGIPEQEGTIDTFLGRDNRDRKLVAVVGESRGKHAITHFKVVRSYKYASLVEFRLETGRTHQIRVHAKYMGHPIFGDPSYGGRSLRVENAPGKIRSQYQMALKAISRQALHAFQLGFLHPEGGDYLEFQSDPPNDFQEALSLIEEAG